MNQVNSTATSAGAAAAREALAGYKPGISKAEAQAMIDAAVKNFVDKGALDAMAQEFRGELAMLGADVDDLMYRVDALETKFAALEARVTALENKPDKVTGVIEWKAGTNEAELYEGGILPIEPGPARDFYPNREGWNRFSNLSVKVNIDGKISDKAQGHVTLWRPDATYDDMGESSVKGPSAGLRGTHIDTAYVDVQDGLFKGVDWRLGRQRIKTGCGLVWDNDIEPGEFVKACFALGGLDLMGAFGMLDASYISEEDEESTSLVEAMYSFGRLSLDGTYVFRAEAGAKRWGIAAGYEGLDVPFLGVKANLKGEFGEVINASGGGGVPSDIDNAYFIRADFVGNNYEPGDWKFGVSWAEQQEAYDAWNYGGNPYDFYVLYNGLPWDYILGEYLQLGQQGAITWTADLEKKWGNSGIYLRWARLVPMYSGIFAVVGEADRQPGYGYLYNDVDLYQVSYDRELTEDVWARLTWARIREDVLSFEFEPVWETISLDYFGGSINVLF